MTVRGMTSATGRKAWYMVLQLLLLASLLSLLDTEALPMLRDPQLPWHHALQEAPLPIHPQQQQQQQAIGSADDLRLYLQSEPMSHRVVHLPAYLRLDQPLTLQGPATLQPLPSQGPGAQEPHVAKDQQQQHQQQRQAGGRGLQQVVANGLLTWTDNTVLDCAGNPVALFIRPGIGGISGNVVLRGITFMNCMGNSSMGGAVQVIGTAGVGNVTFIGCTWVNNVASRGAAVYLERVSRVSTASGPSTTVTFISCSFRNNSAISTLEGNTDASLYGGGAVMVQYGDANPCDDGTPSRASACLPISFISCTFESNTADRSGGVLYGRGDPLHLSSVAFQGCTFINNMASKGAVFYGGDHSEVPLFDRCTVIGNRCRIAAGTTPNSCGAVCTDEYSNGGIRVISNSYFENNGGPSCTTGGAVNVETSTTSVYLTNLTFFNNSVSSLGGAVFVNSTGSGVRIQDCYFEQNTAGAQGGAIAINRQSALEMRSCTVVNNTALLCGGGVDIYQCTSINLTGMNVTNNEARMGGGVNQDRLGATTIASSTFSLNSAWFGAGFSGGRDSDVVVDSTVFDGNNASYGGGLECRECNSLFVTRSLITSNTAQSGAGLGLFQIQENVLIQDTVISLNKASGFSMDVFYDADRGTVGGGGGMALTLSGNVTLQNVTISDNEATLGGGIYLSQVCPPAVTPICSYSVLFIAANTTLSTNIAWGGNGGAIYAAQADSLSIRCQDPTVFFNPGLNGTVKDLFATGTGSMSAAGCPHWSGNLAPYGRGNVLATAAYSAVLLTPSQAVRYESNTPINITAEVVDLWGQRTGPAGADVNDTTFSVTIPSGQGVRSILTGTNNFVSNNGVVSTSTQLALQSQPGDSTLSIKIEMPDGTPADLYRGLAPTLPALSINTRSCVFGEVTALQGLTCQNCSVGFYSFNPLNTSCDVCPDYALCSSTAGNVLVPEDNYWHSHPYSNQFFRCRGSKACIYTNRSKRLQEVGAAFAFSVELLTPQQILERGNVTAVMEVQCNEGHTGNLCGECLPGFGHTGIGNCARCPSVGLNTLYIILSYLLTITLIFFTIRTTLMQGLSAAAIQQIQTLRQEIKARRQRHRSASRRGRSSKSFTTNPSGNAALHTGEASVTAQRRVPSVSPAHNTGGVGGQPGPAGGTSAGRPVAEGDEKLGPDAGSGPAVIGQQSQMVLQASEQATPQASERSLQGGTTTRLRARFGDDPRTSSFQQQAAKPVTASPSSSGVGVLGSEGEAEGGAGKVLEKGDEDGKAKAAASGWLQETSDGQEVDERRKLNMKPPHSIILKILTNYLQVVALVRDVPLEYPKFLRDFFNLSGQASAAVGTMVSIDCSLPDMSLPKALQATLISVSVPGILVVLSIPIWLLLWAKQWHKKPKPEEKDALASPGPNSENGDRHVGTMSMLVRREKSVADAELAEVVAKDSEKRKLRVGEYLPARLIVTTLSIVFCLYSNVCDSLLSLFQCPQLDIADSMYSMFSVSKGQYLLGALNTRCYEGVHLFFVLLLGLPGVILFAFGLPIASALFLRIKRPSFDDSEFSLRYGFFYEDYKRSAFYWESIILLRKLFLVIASVFLGTVSIPLQMTVMLAIVFVALSWQLLTSPYELKHMNFLELMSLCATVLTYYFLLLLVTTATETVKQILSVALILINVAFLGFVMRALILAFYYLALKELDTDGDGQISREEVMAYFKARLGFMAPMAAALASLFLLKRVGKEAPGTVVPVEQQDGDGSSTDSDEGSGRGRGRGATDGRTNGESGGGDANGTLRQQLHDAEQPEQPPPAARGPAPASGIPGQTGVPDMAGAALPPKAMSASNGAVGAPYGSPAKSMASEIHLGADVATRMALSSDSTALNFAPAPVADRSMADDALDVATQAEGADAASGRRPVPLRGDVRSASRLLSSPRPEDGTALEASSMFGPETGTDRGAEIGPAVCTPGAVFVAASDDPLQTPAPSPAPASIPPAGAIAPASPQPDPTAGSKVAVSGPANATTGAEPTLGVNIKPQTATEDSSGNANSSGQRSEASISSVDAPSALASGEGPGARSRLRLPPMQVPLR